MSGSDSSITRSPGGTGGGQGDCNIRFETTLASPDPDVVDELEIGEIVDILSVETPIRGIVARTIDGRDIGAITRDILLLRRCIEDGTTYEAEIVRINGGSVTVAVRPQ